MEEANQNLTDEEKKAIENLKSYIKADIFYNEGTKIESDFDKFCYGHCKDINVVLNLVNDLLKSNIELDKECTRLEEKEIDLEKENKEQKEMLVHRIKYTSELEKDLFENCSNYVIPKEKIEEKIKFINEFEENLYYKENVILVLNELLASK